MAATVIELQSQPDTPQAFYAGLRLMAWDSFVVDVADTPANEQAFGRPGSGRSPGAFPQARVLSLCEVGTHVLWRSLIKPHRRSEVVMARYLVRFLLANMLVLWDRGFLSYDLVRDLRQRKAHLLARLKKNHIFTPIRRLSDGSYLAKLYPSPRHRARDRVTARGMRGAWWYGSSSTPSTIRDGPVRVRPIVCGRRCWTPGSIRRNA